MPGWVLHIVLASGDVEPVGETCTPGRRQAPPEMLALIRRAAAAHSVPAVLATGAQVFDDDDLPGKHAGLYFDPGGEPGVREWTGTEWSPFLRVVPGAAGPGDQETGLARIWSPLSAEELGCQSWRELRHSKRLARRLRVDAIPASAQDDPPISGPVTP
jgi:hypothetical protein